MMTVAEQQLTLAVFEPITVHPTRDVLLRGAAAISDGSFLFAHQHVPPRPASVTEDRVWLTMLDLTAAPAAGQLRPLNTPAAARASDVPTQPIPLNRD